MRNSKLKSINAAVDLALQYIDYRLTSNTSYLTKKNVRLGIEYIKNSDFYLQCQASRTKIRNLYRAFYVKHYENRNAPVASRHSPSRRTHRDYMYKKY